MRRRTFIGAAGGAMAAPFASGFERASGLVLEADEPLSAAAPVEWAAARLRAALTAAGLSSKVSIVASGPGRGPDAPARDPESLALRQDRKTGRISARGSDARGLAYALGELEERVRYGDNLETLAAIRESPANPVRCVMKQFTSESLDKPWFYDRDGWTHYLDLLAAQRWNRFHLAFGLGYDNLNRVEDSYFLFLYPFLVDVPGYAVRATNLPDEERERNLAMLQFIGEKTIARGMDFQLGVWMHGYEWPSASGARHRIEGLTRETHAAYCRDALTTVLRKCPAISSMAFRIHGESGIAEGSYDFWATVFDGVKRCGRAVEIDLHAKGIDDTMIAKALATGMPVNLSPKFSAEHLGMPYHQAAIREVEMPVAGHTGAGLMALSEGSRVFTRYGYADLLRDDRKYTVRHRVFSGTQRILLWDDPVFAGAYARAFRFCGSTGADLMEPLTCRGRRGSGVPGRRSGYAEAKIEPRWDWEKYAGWYRTWGRALYNPETGADVFGRGGTALAPALSAASRILPIVTSAYLPSAACDGYWPEIYWNQPLTEEPKNNPYGDTEAPKVFQNASPLDPRMFSSMREFAAELAGGARSGKYSPIEVAQWLETRAAQAMEGLRAAADTRSAVVRRAAADIAIQAGLGRFFAAKFRAGVLYAIYQTTGDARALDESLRAYRAARARWVEVVAAAQGVYAADLSASDRFDERGQWADRLAGIDQDISEMDRRFQSADGRGDARSAAAIDEALRPFSREPEACIHAPPKGLRRGDPAGIEIQVRRVKSARLHYRHVNQAERFQTVEMEDAEKGYRARIPADYTGSPYPLQYYFELRASVKNAWLYPGFGPDLINPPYFVIQFAE